MNFKVEKQLAFSKKLAKLSIILLSISMFMCMISLPLRKDIFQKMFEKFDVSVDRLKIPDTFWIYETQILLFLILTILFLKFCQKEQVSQKAWLLGGAAFYFGESK